MFYVELHIKHELLSLHCGKDFSEKFELLEHPLYDDLLRLARQYLPEEIKQQELNGRRILLSIGMILPYKGVPDLICTFQQVVQGNKEHRLHLIIAGQLQDPEVSEVLDGLQEHVRKCISLVARRLQEDELAGVMRLAHVSSHSWRPMHERNVVVFLHPFWLPLILSIATSFLLVHQLYPPNVPLEKWQ